MVARLLKKVERLFPERQLLLQAEGRVRYITLSRRLQMTAAGIALCGIGAVGYISLGHTIGDRLVAHKQAEVERAEASSAELNRMVSDLQRQLAVAQAELARAVDHSITAEAEKGELSGVLADSRARLAALEAARDGAIAERDELQRKLSAADEALSSKASNLAQLNKQLETKGGELRLTEAQQAAQQNRARALESDLQSANARASQYKSTLDANERRLQQLAQEKDQAAAERDRLRARVAELDTKLANIETLSTAAGDRMAAERDRLRARVAELEAKLSSAEKLSTIERDRAATERNQAPAKIADPEEKKPTGGAREEAAEHHASASGDQPPQPGKASELERLIASTGLDIEKLVHSVGSAPAAQGGPYVALDAAKRAAAPEDARRAAILQHLTKTLPLAEPLGHYQLESPFGMRADPINGHQSFHPGVDLSAPYKSPVLSTAPGVVIFAGVRDSYGKVVEIDHGNGITTLYAHLHRTLVSRGQKVSAHQEIGQLGTTGRSTGPHVHYEIQVDGVPVDPEKFLQAGKNVVQASKR